MDNFYKNCRAYSTVNVHSYTAINFCIYHKFLANNSLISTLNRMGHKSQYGTNSQTGKLYLCMMQSSCLQSLCGHVHSLCSKCSPLPATQACNLLRHSLTAKTLIALLSSTENGILHNLPYRRSHHNYVTVYKEHINYKNAFANYF